MKLVTKNVKTPVTVIVTPWASNDGKEPQKSVSAEIKFEVTINGTKVRVSQNSSKSSVQYQYLSLNNKWHWTRDTFTPDTEYVTYVKPAKVETKAGSKEKSPVASTAVTELKRQVKVVKANK